MSDINTGRTGTPLGDALHEIAELRGLLAETVPDPEYRRMQDIEIERLREALKKAQGGVTDYAKQYVALRADNDLLREALATAETRLFHCSNAVELLRGVEAENDRLREALTEAREDVAHWAGYASDYFKEKHDLAGDLARIDAALAKEAGK